MVILIEFPIEAESPLVSQEDCKCLPDTIQSCGVEMRQCKHNPSSRQAFWVLDQKKTTLCPDVCAVLPFPRQISAESHTEYTHRKACGILCHFSGYRQQE